MWAIPKCDIVVFIAEYFTPTTHTGWEGAIIGIKITCLDSVREVWFDDCCCPKSDGGE